MAALDGILETALYAEDLDAAAAFYGGLLGLDEIARVAGRHVFFRCGPSVLLIFNPEATIRPPSPEVALAAPPHGAKGPGHACFRASPPVLDAWRARLIDKGVPIETEITWPNGARSLYFRDPAGNSLEIAEPKLWDLG
ncbi:bleomycin resistance protein [Rhizobium rhizosphaerae]|uniref:Bleomycin resistance protein n=1 Tax=Xaviernesmea rhizosphaerae TaxID=1672749 RepID=A0A1Q9AEM5_9HYPH|nr:VOC family protein [Xaviernesmea rhizosphaerae]OLP53407.1 bleomycin resistance protein [Xaviernesmea rhizosphaerae]OQP84884.1 glyoxalase/bleomycin resistance/extradiol dioxygenase family protein [Xaviernesmea rhizosphaerae]